MAENDQTPVPASHVGNGLLKRELNGASFLTLEHIAHMALVVVVAVLTVMGVLSALSMWTGSMPGPAEMLMGNMPGLAVLSTKAVEASMSLGIVAALLVLVPALVVLDRRTRAEWHKRPEYAGRLAYKVPVYTAMGVLAILKVVTFIDMLYVVIASLAYLGLQGAPIGSMYLTTFLPALIALVIFAGAGWYVFNLIKGRDNGRMYSMAMAGLGTVIVVALVITSLVVLHNGNNSFAPSTTEPSSPSSSSSSNMFDDKQPSSKSYQDMLDQLMR